MNLEQIMESLWRVSWQGGLFVLALWILTTATHWLKRPIPAQVRYWMWWIACVQFLVRFAGAVPLPVSYVEPVVSRAVEVAPSSWPPRTITTVPETPVVPPSTAVVAPHRHISWPATAGMVYIAGFLVLLVNQGRRQWNTRRLLQQCHPLSSELGGSHPIYESSLAPCPLIAGLWSPKIVLPQGLIGELSEQDLRLCIAHEGAHLRRRDLQLAVLPALVQQVLYFHPLVWLATRELKLACEEACDAEALAATGGSRSAYAELLVRTVQPTGSTAALGTAFGYRLLQRRLKMLNLLKVSSTHPRKAWTALVGLSALAALPYTVTAAQGQHDKKQQPSSASHPAASKPVTKAASKAKSAVAKAKAKANVATPGAKLTALNSTSGVAKDAPTLTAPMKLTTTGDVVEVSPGVYSVKFTGTNLRTALARLFEVAKTNYSIHAGVGSEPVTCVMNRVELPMILGVLARSVREPFTYAVEGGTFIVLPKGLVADEAGTSRDTAAKAMAAAPAKAMGAAPIWRRDPGVAGEILEAPRANGLETIITLDMETADIRDALRRVFAAARQSYMIDPDVQGTVTVSMKNITAEMALKTIVRQVDATYSIEGGLIHVSRRKNE